MLITSGVYVNYWKPPDPSWRIPTMAQTTFNPINQQILHYASIPVAYFCTTLGTGERFVSKVISEGPAFAFGFVLTFGHTFVDDVLPFGVKVDTSPVLPGL